MAHTFLKFHFLSLCFFCFHESTMSFSSCQGTLTSQMWSQPFFIAVGTYGSCGSLEKRAKICSQNKSSGTAVAPANPWAVTHFLLVLAFAPSLLWLELAQVGHHPCAPTLGASAECRTSSGEMPSGSGLENYLNWPKGVRMEWRKGGEGESGRLGRWAVRGGHGSVDGEEMRATAWFFRMF